MLAAKPRRDAAPSAGLGERRRGLLGRRRGGPRILLTGKDRAPGGLRIAPAESRKLNEVLLRMFIKPVVYEDTILSTEQVAEVIAECIGSFSRCYHSTSSTSFSVTEFYRMSLQCAATTSRGERRRVYGEGQRGRMTWSRLRRVWSRLRTFPKRRGKHAECACCRSRGQQPCPSPGSRTF